MSEASAQADTLVALQRAFPDGVFYRRNVGKARDPRSGRVIRFGIPGQADIAGVIAGRAVEIEMKAPRGRQSVEQANWQRAVERAGGIYIIGRSAEEVIRALGEHFGHV